MKVDMALAPGDRPGRDPQAVDRDPAARRRGAADAHDRRRPAAELRRPHADGNRRGLGRSKAARAGPWRNCFIPYIWLGAEERGLAWFAENDKGWVTEKEKSKTPTHELVREGGPVVLRVYLINRPVTLTRAATGAFRPAGLAHQAAAGRLATTAAGHPRRAGRGPVRRPAMRQPGPAARRLADRRTRSSSAAAARPFDEAWLSQLRRSSTSRRWSTATGTGRTSVRHFAGRAKRRRPATGRWTVYQEEMAAATPRPEWAVFQDEWNATRGPRPRDRRPGGAGPKATAALGRPADITFGPSYRDFGCWFADQWLRRGVSLYWDNTYPHLSTNTRTTAAYLAEDGQVQPCLIIWNQREYHQRVWHLLQQWRRQRPEPLEWVLHMTNTLVLPIHTWGTADLDHELSRDEPFSPDWLRTETTGRQIGNLPLSLYAVVGSENRVLRRLAETLPKARRGPDPRSGGVGHAGGPRDPAPRTAGTSC